MNEMPSSDLTEIAQRVVASLYDTVVDGASYEPMFDFMDEAIEQLLSSEHTQEEVKNWEPHFLPHFDRAAHVFDVMSRHETLTPLSFVKQKQSPTAVINQNGKIVAVNSTFEAVVPAFPETGINDFFATPSDASRFTSLARANTLSCQAIVNVVLAGHTKTTSLLIGQLPDIERLNGDDTYMFAMPIRARWTDQTGALLQQAFGLHDAELETLRTFVETGSVKEAAELRGRSIRTVRTQLSRIFGQLEISGQTELALF